MRTIVHLSDLHFGREQTEIIKPLIAAVNALHPHAIVVSGDLTHRARPDQYRKAKSFLNKMPFPKVIVPGNHDVPYFNLRARLFKPSAHFEKFMGTSAEPFYSDKEMAIVGVNTVRPWTLTGNGKVGKKQLDSIFDRFRDLDRNVTKIVVAHHPFDLPKGKLRDRLVRGARRAHVLFNEAGVDIVLGGHAHVSHISHASKRFLLTSRNLVVQAGSASSRHGRREPFSFNVLKLSRLTISISVYFWSDATNKFLVDSPQVFRHTSSGWTAVSQQPKS